jgi:MIF4G domain
MEPRKHSYEGYFNTKKSRSESFTSISAQNNAYRKPKKTYKKKKQVYSIDEIISFKDNPKSLIKPCSEFSNRKINDPNKKVVIGWRNTPKLIKSDLDSMTKNLKSLLNKLTPTNFESIKEKLSEHLNPEISMLLSDLLLIKACMEVKYSETYSRLSRDLILKFPFFRNDLLKACQDIFESQALEAEDITLNKKKVLGCVTFIGELLNMKVLSAKVIISCCESLLNKSTEEAAEGVCYLLSTCSNVFSSSKFKETGHNLISKLQAKSFAYSIRLKFQVQDLIESRKIQTIVMRNSEKPVNLNQI